MPRRWRVLKDCGAVELCINPDAALWRRAGSTEAEWPKGEGPENPAMIVVIFRDEFPVSVHLGRNVERERNAPETHDWLRYDVHELAQRVELLK
ncbi:hypothetical protein BH11PLA1_BH11PLA1_10690 [soil metagenome]